MADGRMRIVIKFPSEDSCVYAERALRYAHTPYFSRPSANTIVIVLETRQAPLLAELLKWSVGSAVFNQLKFYTSEYIEEQ